jgi:hypothetical protein
MAPPVVPVGPSPDPDALEEAEVTTLPEWVADAPDVWEDEESDEEEGTSEQLVEPSSISQNILPLEAAALPHPCYLVVDRFAELVARPLHELIAGVNCRASVRRHAPCRCLITIG